MLQYPVPLPPLSLTSSKRTPLIRRDTSDDLQNGSLTHKRAFNDKLVPSRPSHHVVPIHVSTAFSTASSPASTPPSTPSPNLRVSTKQVPRSPLISSPHQLPSPIPRSPHPLKSNLSSYDNKSYGSSNSSVVADVLAPGDLVGEGIPLQGETIVRVPISSSEPRADYDDPAKEFKVVRALGTGSYAVVYLVREVLSRPRSPPSDDEHGVAVTGSMEMDDSYFARHHAVEYGRDYAIKVLSKANLDRDALDAQLFEVCCYRMHVCACSDRSLPRLPSISLSPPTPTSSPCIARSRRLHFCFSSSSLCQVKISSTSWNRLAITMKSIPWPRTSRRLHPLTRVAVAPAHLRARACSRPLHRLSCSPALVCAS